MPEQPKDLGKTRYMTEFFDEPKAWSLEDHETDYPWLTDKDIERLDAFPFDYGDIMEAEGYFIDEDSMLELLMCTKEDLNNYCLILWRKDWPMVHRVLRQRARANSVGTFRNWANNGNATAMSILANGVMKLNSEAQKHALSIQLVNDLKEDEGD